MVVYQRDCPAGCSVGRKPHGYCPGAHPIAEGLRNIRFNAALRLTVGDIRRRDMETLMKTAFAALLLLLSTAATACNTVEGVGQDTQAVGQAVEDAADANK